MGFTIESFFYDLFKITENLDLSDEEMLAQLKNEISLAFEYAQQSGVIVNE